jgi:transposase-like protein
MVAVALKCPFCGSEDVRPYGSAKGKKRYACDNPRCTHKTFYAEYRYNGCKPEVKKDILTWATDGDENTGNSAGIGYKHRYRDKSIKKKRIC